MKIAYANIKYHPNSIGGGNAHVFQFIRNASLQGHEVWTWPYTRHPHGRVLPDGIFNRIKVLRSCEAILFRITSGFPSQTQLMKERYKRLLGTPKIIWEFNTIPEFGLLVGRTRAEVDRTVETFRKYAKHCNLAVCVSDEIACYVRDNIGVGKVITIPNGSDPNHFRPDQTVVPRLKAFSGRLNVVWMGSAGLNWTDFTAIENAANLVLHSGLKDRVEFHLIAHGMPSMSDMPANIHFHGAEQYEKLPEWLAGMDVGLVCYKPGPGDYSSPLKFYDYLASGLAVITTGQPQVKKVLCDIGQQQSALDHGDAEGIVAVLKKFVERPDLLEDHKCKSRLSAVNQYSWEKTVRSVFDAIRGLDQ